MGYAHTSWPMHPAGKTACLPGSHVIERRGGFWGEHDLRRPCCHARQDPPVTPGGGKLAFHYPSNRVLFISEGWDGTVPPPSHDERYRLQFCCQRRDRGDCGDLIFFFFRQGVFIFHPAAIPCPRQVWRGLRVLRGGDGRKSLIDQDWLTVRVRQDLTEAAGFMKKSTEIFDIPGFPALPE